MHSTELSDTLHAAAGYLRTFGWQRGQVGYDGGPRCAGGALMSVLGTNSEAVVDHWLRDAQFPGLIGLPKPVGSVLRGCVMNYNDFIARSATDVIDLFEGAAFQLAMREALKDAPSQPEPALVGIP